MTHVGFVAYWLSVGVLATLCGWFGGRLVSALARALVERRRGDG